MLETLSLAEEDCLAANVEENDYTILTGDDLEWELELFNGAVGKRVAFIENQVRLCSPSTSRFTHSADTDKLILCMC
jgi:hypothetical protein